MKTCLKTFLLSYFLLIAFSLHAQTDSLTENSDSLNAELIHEMNVALPKLTAQRIADSIERNKLEEQIKALKTTDNLKKEELQEQLNSLNTQEEKRLEAKKRTIDSLRETAKAFPVQGFFEDTLFSIYSGQGSFSALDRAAAIEKRIKKIGKVAVFQMDTIRLENTEMSVNLILGETILMSIYENDALWNNTTTDALAKNYKVIITNELIRYKDETSLYTIFKEIGLALLVLGLTVALIFYLLKLFNWINSIIQSQEGKKIDGIKIKNYTVFDSKKQVNFFLSVAKVLKWFFVLLIIYIALPILFGIFPWTQNVADTLFGYILNPVKNIAKGIWNYLPKLITIIVIVIVFRYVLKGVYYLKNEVEEGKLTLTGFYPDWANPTYQILRVLIYAFMFVLIFPYLPGSDSPVFKGVSVFLGVLFTFGSSGSLSNIIAGIVLTYMRLFKIGDRVKIGDVVGDIMEKTLLVTRVKTAHNEIISIPNSTVMSSYTINFSGNYAGNGLIIHTTVTIGYDVPWKKIHAALLEAADRTKFLLKDPKPHVLQTGLEDFYVSYELNGHTKEPNRQAAIYSALHANIQDCCNEAGIEIMSPHYRAARDGNETTIPSDYLSKDYQKPSFNVHVNKGKEKNEADN